MGKAAVLGPIRMVRMATFFARHGWLSQRPPLPPERLASRARAAAGYRNPKASLARLARLWLRSQTAIDGQVRRRLPVDPQVLALADGIVTECLRRVGLYRPEADLAPLERARRELRRMRFPRKDAARFAEELRDLTPSGPPPAFRTRTPGPRLLPWRPRRENPEVLARRARSIARGQDQALRGVRLLRLATLGDIAVKRRQARGETVDERLLEVVHGVIVEATRRCGAFDLSVEVLEGQLADILALSYDHEAGERFAAELAEIADSGR